MTSLIGTWILSYLVYQGNVVPPFRPQISVYYTFSSSSKNELFYFDRDDGSHCHRIAEYRIENDYILQQVISVDEDNSSFCSSDTDMQMDQQSQVKYEVQNEKLILHLKLSDEDIQYVFDRL